MRGFLYCVLTVWVAFIGRVQATPERVFYMNEGRVLQGVAYKPAGPGPFPAVIYSQNTVIATEDAPPADPFPKLGRLFTSRGYVLFIPAKYVSGTSEDDENGTAGDGNLVEGARAYQQNIATSMLSLKAQSFVDPNRIVAIGTIGGATATLLLAEQNMDVRGYVAFSPACANWKRSPKLQAALKRAVEKADAPIFLIQPKNDVTLGPSEVLGKILDKKGRPNRSKVYPPFGAKPKDARSFVISGTEIWGPDVLEFLDRVMK